MINERREAMAEKGLDYPDQPNDMLMWLMDAANLEARTDYQLASRMLAINFAAIHTSSMTFTQAFYYLAVEPEKYLQPLRDEVEDALEREGWTKSALDQMYKVDSFIKESQRLHSMASLLLSRMTAVDYTFSNGVTVPEGTLVAANLLSRHLDPTRFPNPETFDGFRYARERELTLSNSDVDPSEIARKAELVTPNIDFLAFGHGRHACPGRWFAAAELKIMVAYTVLKYDVKMKEGEGRPKDLWFGAACLPNARAEVLFRRRKA